MLRDTILISILSVIMLSVVLCIRLSVIMLSVIGNLKNDCNVKTLDSPKLSNQHCVGCKAKHLPL